MRQIVRLHKGQRPSMSLSHWLYPASSIPSEHCFDSENDVFSRVEQLFHAIRSFVVLIGTGALSNFINYELAHQLFFVNMAGRGKQAARQVCNCQKRDERNP